MKTTVITHYGIFDIIKKGDWEILLAYTKSSRRVEIWFRWGRSHTNFIAETEIPITKDPLGAYRKIIRKLCQERDYILGDGERTLLSFNRLYEELKTLGIRRHTEG